MNLLNNFLHNDFVWIPLYIGMIGFLGHAWFTESTKVFTSVHNVTTSPVTSWPYDWTADRVTDASIISEQFAQLQSLRLRNTIASEERILNALNETRESTSTILRKLEEIRQIRLETSQIHSAFVNLFKFILLFYISIAEKRNWTFILPSWIVSFNHLNYFSLINLIE